MSTLDNGSAHRACVCGEPAMTNGAICTQFPRCTLKTVTPQPVSPRSHEGLAEWVDTMYGAVVIGARTYRASTIISRVDPEFWAELLHDWRERA